MADPRLKALSPLKLSVAVKALQERGGGAETLLAEPLAIVGLGCRFPGASSPSAFRALLREGRDAVREVPKDRWDNDALFDADPDSAGRTYVRRAGFLDAVDGFDAAFFGITPREARMMDPQQRLLMEIAWEALEDASIAPDAWRGRRAGVFVGVTSVDYALRSMHSGDLTRIDAYSGTGAAPCVAAGRIAYTLGFHGPALTVDTACSSSLVALHLAAQSLRSGESDLALAGGVSLMLSPEGTIYLSRLKGLAPDGRCKAFDEGADGFVRGEGCGLVVLKRLSDAVRDGDRIRALLRGTAVNHDGHSSGFTVPHGPAQRDVVERALAASLLNAEQLSYVEAHGTGTALGDPIELEALGAVHAGRQTPLRIGSVKTGIGHLEAAAGIAGVAKVILAMEDRTFYPHLHLKTPTKHVDWARLGIEVPTELTPWNVAEGDRLRAGVSSFGLSGTNAHVVLEEAPTLSTPAAESPARQSSLLLLSARTDSALRTQASQLAQVLRGVPLPDVEVTLATGRVHMEERLAFLASSEAEAMAALNAVALGEFPASVRRGHTSGARPSVGFLFPGQGAQRPGQGRALFATEPVFRGALERADAVLRPLGVPLIDFILASPDDHATSARLRETAMAQPVLVAHALALAALWQDWGVEPDAVLGHSVGEIAAAAVAGVLGFEDALRVAAARGQAMSALPERGGMAAVLGSEAQVRPLLAGRIDIAAINGARETVVAGDEAALTRLEARAAAAGFTVKRLEVSHAFHSPLVEPALSAVETAWGSVPRRPATRLLISGLSGRRAGAEVLEPAYGRAQARGAVRFADGLRTLAAEGCQILVELGPGATLSALARRTLGAGIAAVPTQRDGATHALDALAELHVQGVKVDWAAVHRRRGGTRIALPTYPFERKRHWIDGPEPIAKAVLPFLNPAVRGADGTSFIHEGILDLSAQRWLRDHAILGTPLLPLAGMLSIVHAVVPDASLSQVEIREPLWLDLDAPRRVRITHGPHEFRIESARGDAWVTHVSGACAPQGEPPAAPAASQGESAVAACDAYARLWQTGIEHGSEFRLLTDIVTSARSARASLAPSALMGVAAASVRLDAALQLFATLWQDGVARVPTGVDACWIGDIDKATRAIATLADDGSGGEAWLTDDAGHIVAALSGLRARRVAREALDSGATRTWTQALSWDLAILGPPQPAKAMRIEIHGEAPALSAALRAAGHTVESGPDVDVLINARSLQTGGFDPARMETLFTDFVSFAQSALRRTRAPRVVVLTRGAASVGVPRVDPVAAALASAAGVLANEHPELHCQRLDLAPAGDDDGEGVLALLDGRVTHDEVAWRQGSAYVRVLTSTGSSDDDRRIPPAGEYALASVAPGTLDALRWQPRVPRAPGPGEVEIAVQAAGLNFRDVLGALAMYPGDPGPPGGECAGTITRVGEGVPGHLIGARVIALAEGGLASSVTVSAQQIAPWPDGLDAPGAGTVPVAWLTASMALRDCASLRSGERVLIHSAAGGVGLAAVRLAIAEGALVFATAGTPAKRAMLRALGVHAALDSRVAFGETLRAATGGAGVDLVLNSLTGDAIPEGLDALAPGGRFVEIGRRGIWSAEAVAARRPDVSYRVLDLHAMDAAALGERLRALAPRVAELGMLPVEVVSAPDVLLAFRRMAAGRHIGKLAVRFGSTTPRRDGTYVITGGTGALGLLTARWLAARGAGHIVLVSRHASVPPKALDEIRAFGARVSIRTADVANESALRSILAEIDASHAPLRGVVHAAGIIEDGALATLDPARGIRVLAPKVRGAVILDTLTRGRNLDFFILFSSAAAIRHTKGQAAYAAANAFMDALASRRRAEGATALSVGWGPWEAGMAAGLDMRTAADLAPMPSALAFAALDRALAGSAPHVAICRPSSATPPPRREAPAARVDVARVPSDSRLTVIHDLVEAAARRVMGLDQSARLDRSRPLRDHGLDSLMAVELRHVLSAEFQTALPSTVVFDHPTLDALSAHLAALLDVDARPALTRAPAGSTGSAIAIVGMGCRFPGAASPEELWALLRDGRVVVSDVPKDRWDVDAWYSPDAEASGRMVTRRAAFVRDIDLFDAPFFGIASREAVEMDPQQRLLLEVAWEALESAGATAEQLEGSRTGVFLGIGNSDWAQRGLRSGDPARIHVWAGTGTVLSIAAGRLSYTLGLRGPALSVDTACSSSLVAVHLACQSLLSGESDMALAAGVNLLLAPEGSVFLSKARALSPDGTCKTFDATADGYGRGEGCGVVVLKRLSDAQAAGDEILAVVRGSAVNQDGRSGGLTAPNGPAQEELLRTALSNAALSPRDIGYVEAHGTGTPLGDPIEVRALSAVLGEGRGSEEKLAIGSLKANIGHLEAAAGVAGLIKAALMVRHGEVPPHPTLKTLTPHIPWDSIPVEVPTTRSVWGGGPRRAGVSAFGFSGTNAHVIVESPPDRRPVDAPADGPFLLPLSARSSEALRALAESWKALARTRSGTDSLADAVSAAAHRRSHHSHRVAVVVSSWEDLTNQLDAAVIGEAAQKPPRVAFAVGRPGAEPLIDAWRARGIVASVVACRSGVSLDQPGAVACRLDHNSGALTLADQQTIRTAGADVVLGIGVEGVLRGDGDPVETLRVLGDLYTRGAPVRWTALIPPSRTPFPLPAYPWQHSRYWIDPPETAAPVPFLGAGVRGADGSTVFEGAIDPVDHRWLTAHRLHGAPVLPLSGIVALAQAVARKERGGHPAVADLKVIAPLTLSERTAIRINCVSDLAFRLESRRGVAWTLHATGRFAENPAEPAAAPDPMNRGGTNVPASDVYARLARSGIEHGTAFRALSHVEAADGVAMARLVETGASGFAAATVWLDAALQVLGALLPGDDALLPVGVRLAWLTPDARPVRVIARLDPTATEDAAADAWLIDDAGVVIGGLSGLQARRVAGAPLSHETDAWIQMPVFEPVAPMTVSVAPLRLAVLGTRGVDELRAEGHEVQVAGSISEIGDVDEVIDLRALDTLLSDEAARARAWCAGLVTLTQDLVRRTPAPRLVVVTRHGASIGTLNPDPSAAALLAMAGVVAREHPELRCRRLDVDRGELRLPLRHAMATSDGETVWREGCGYVRSWANASGPIPDRRPPTAAPFQLLTQTPGTLEALGWRTVPRTPPGPGQIEIEVEAAGLNFRDVLGALGLYPGVAGPPGGECAGVVSAIGSGVRSVEVGDRVVALADAAMASYVVVPETLVAPWPIGVDSPAAAAMPVVCLTAAVALEDIAALRAGERVLVHSGAGGVGLAAVRLALALGAHVYATASSPFKRALLLELGVRAVLDSRTPFGEALRAATGGAGVDVVLNSLTDGAIGEGIAALAPGGRFIEIGRRGIWTREQVAALRPDVAYHILDLQQETKRDPGRIGRRLQEALTRIGALPTAGVSASEVVTAFRRMAAGRHVGKLAVRVRAPRIRREGAYLITGGMGALGLATARWLAARGAGHIVLVSRGGSESIDDLTALGARISVRHADVANLAAMADIIHEIGPTLRGIVHAAGVLDDAVVANLGAEKLDRVLSPKVDGALHLDALTRNRDLDFFVMYSSASAVRHTPGQAAYAAANAFMDGLAARRRAEGRPALCIGWGPWSIGMARDLDRDLMAAAKVQPLDPGEALFALERCLSGGAPHVRVIRPASLAVAPVQESSHAAKGLVSRLAAAPLAQRRSLLRDAIEVEALRVLAMSGPLDPARPLREIGLDSLMAVELRHALADRTGASLPSTLLFDHPTLEALTAHLAVVLGLEEVKETAAPRPTSGNSDALAIVGMACRLPGADTPEELWDLVRSGRVVVGDVPPDRWDAEAWYDANADAAGRISTRRGAFLTQVDRFDAGFFGIAPREAIEMDPQQRVLLEVAWEALERAGLPAESLSGSATGVFLGISNSDWAQRTLRARDHGRVGAWSGTGSASSVAAGRLSYTLGLHGPALAVDTACSSSLVAVHLAAQSLRNGECEAAIVGGVSLILSPDTSVSLSRAHALSPDGTCKTFDEAADGYGRGEGCGVVVLKRLADAIANGDPVIAVIRGTAVNQDGRSGGLTAPNGIAQETLLRAALANASLAAHEVGYVEAHGTGTPLGDPIEVRALAAVFGEGRGPSEALQIGALKANIGHLEAAAGVAGLIKAALMVARGELTPHPSLRTLSPHIPWATIPIEVTPRPSAWSQGPRRAGVSAFGFSGTNAHVIVEAPPEAAEAPLDVIGPMLLPLAARSPEGLRALAQAWRTMALTRTGAALLADAVATAAHRRSHHPYRLAVWVSTWEDVALALSSPVVPKEPALRVPRVALVATEGVTKAHLEATLETWRTRGIDAFPIEKADEKADMVLVLGRAPEGRELASDVKSLAALYVSGAVVNWTALMPRPLRPFPLPTYPFQRERYWIEVDDTPAPTVAREEHPVLGRRVAVAVPNLLVWERTVDHQSLPWLRDHRVGSMPVVPAAAFVEWALAAARETAPDAALIDVELTRVLALPFGARTELQCLAWEGTVRVCARPAGASDWVEHARARIGPAAPRHAISRVDLSSLRESCAESIAPTAVEARLSTTGVVYGPAFRRLRRFFSGPEGGLAEVDPPPHGDFDPATLDALFQAAGLLEGSQVGVPVAIGSITIQGDARTVAWAHAKATGDGADLLLLDSEGRVLVDVRGFRTRALDAPIPQRLVLRYEEVALAGNGGARRVVVVGAKAQTGLAAAAFEARGCSVVQVTELPHGEAADVVVDLRALDATDDGSGTWRTFTDAVSVAKQLAGLASPPRLWLVSRGMDAGGLGSSALSAIVATLALELPALRAVHADIGSSTAFDALADAVLADGAEDHLLQRGDSWQAPRLVPLDAVAGTLDLAGSALVTGGTGAVGLAVAERLVARGVRDLVLVSRRGDSGLDAGARARIEKLRRDGAHVIVDTADVSAREDVARVLAVARARSPLRVVVHAAGVLDDATIPNLDLARARRVFAPKVEGALHLDAQTADDDLSAFILVSSAAAVLGSAGQASYAAANAVLDAIAVRRRARGLRATAIGFGPWAGPGMASNMSRAVAALQPADALDALWALSGSSVPAALVIHLDVAELRRRQPLLAARPLFGTDNGTPPRGRLAEALSAAVPLDQASLVENWLHGAVEEALQLPAARISPAEPLSNLGLDSLMALDLKNRAESELGVSLPVARFLAGGSVASLSGELLEAWKKGAAETSVMEEGEI